MIGQFTKKIHIDWLVHKEDTYWYLLYSWCGLLVFFRQDWGCLIYIPQTKSSMNECNSMPTKKILGPRPWLLLWCFYCWPQTGMWLLHPSTKTQTSRHLLVQSQQWRHQNNVWNLFQVNNKDNRTMSLTSLSCLY